VNKWLSRSTPARSAFRSGNDPPGSTIAVRPGSQAALNKVRAVYSDNHYGPQLELRKIREGIEADQADGWCPPPYDVPCLAPSRFALLHSADAGHCQRRIADAPLRTVFLEPARKHRAALLTLPAATHTPMRSSRRAQHSAEGVTRTCITCGQDELKITPR